MTVAQEIAGLLGETAAETKITLLDLCDSLLEEGEKSRGRKWKEKARDCFCGTGFRSWRQEIEDGN